MDYFSSDHHFNNFYINIYSSTPWLHHVQGNKVLLNNKVVEILSDHPDSEVDTTILEKSKLITHWKTKIKEKDPVHLRARALTIQTMNKALTKKWNETIKPHHKVLHGGDFAFPAGGKRLKRVLDGLNGEKDLILGNHDLKPHKMIEGGFNNVYNNLKTSLDDFEVEFCHYPFMNPIFNEYSKFDRVLPQYKKKLPCEGEKLKKLLNEVNAKDHESIKIFLDKALKLNLHLDKKEVKSSYERLKRYVSMVIGTRPINNGQILIHGHTHNENKRFANMINICGEAWDYKPVSKQELIDQIKAYQEELNTIKKSSFKELAQFEEQLSYYAKAYYYNKDNCSDFKEIYFINQAYLSIKENSTNFRIPKNFSKQWYKLMVDNNMFIDKKDLVDQTFYKGHCRNANIALWDENENKFYYLREKFGNTFIESINHPKDDDGFDLFIPKEATDFNQEIYDRYLKYKNPKS